MEKLLLGISLSEIWNVIKSPKFIIVYMVATVVLMGLIVVAAMVNERRLSNVNDRLKKAASSAENKTSRFDSLKKIDLAEKPDETFAEEFTLKELCDEFRNFAANELHLYYDVDTVRSFVAGLATSKLLILQGMSGTGKTSLAFAFGEFLGNPAAVIPVQPMWKERSDLVGYYNEFTKRFNETPLLCKMYEANGSKKIFITILDEMNIARVEYYFAEFLSLMEIPNPALRKLEIVSDVRQDDPERLTDGSILLPDNMWFLGTANNDDSTFAISDKVYDRAMIIQLDKRAEPFEAPSCKRMSISAAAFAQKVRDVLTANVLSDRTAEKLGKLDTYLKQRFRISFGNRVMRQISSYVPVYVACGGDELAALDDVITKKVLRKLEMQNLSYRKKDAEELISFITDTFGEGSMPKAAEFITGIVIGG